MIAIAEPPYGEKMENAHANEMFSVIYTPGNDFEISNGVVTQA